MNRITGTSRLVGERIIWSEWVTWSEFGGVNNKGYMRRRTHVSLEESTTRGYMYRYAVSIQRVAI